jgi:hypothetical protein
VLGPTELIRLSVGIENRIDAQGELWPVPGKASTLFSVSRHQAGYARYFRHDLPTAVRREIEGLDPEVALQDQRLVCGILGQYTPPDGAFAGRGYVFDKPPSPAQFPDAVFRDGSCVILVGGEPVSWAWTADESDQAAELAVETATRYRRRGYARQVCAAWAAHVMGKGQVAFYTHEVGNVASEALARSLVVVAYARVTTYEARAAPG